MFRTMHCLCLTLALLAGSSFMARQANAEATEAEKVEALGASLCKAVHDMSGNPILDSYSIKGNTITMKVYWFGLITKNKYTSNITLYVEPGTSKVTKIDYSDNGPIAYDPAYIEKWRRELNDR